MQYTYNNWSFSFSKRVLKWFTFTHLLCCHIFLHLLEEFTFIFLLEFIPIILPLLLFSYKLFNIKVGLLFLQYLMEYFYVVTNLSGKANHSMYCSVHTRWTVERPPAFLFSIGNWWNILGCDCGPGLSVTGWKLVALFLEGHLLHLDKRLLNRNRVAN